MASKFFYKVCKPVDCKTVFPIWLEKRCETDEELLELLHMYPNVHFEVTRYKVHKVVDILRYVY